MQTFVIAVALDLRRSALSALPSSSSYMQREVHALSLDARLKRMVVDPRVLRGKPVIEGARTPVVPGRRSHGLRDERSRDPKRVSPPGSRGHPRRLAVCLECPAPGRGHPNRSVAFWLDSSIGGQSREELALYSVAGRLGCESDKFHQKLAKSQIVCPRCGSSDSCSWLSWPGVRGQG